MAKRRIDKRFVTFLVVITVAVGAVAAGGFAWQKLRPHAGDPKQLTILGDRALDAGDVDKAAHFYAQASAAAPEDTTILVKLGSALELLAAKDPIYLGQARQEWNKAVSVDPHCAPALDKLLASYEEQTELFPNAEVFGQIRSVCDKLLAIRPGDGYASAQKQIAIIRQYLTNQTASVDEVRKAIDVELPALIKKEPDNPELPLILSRARVQKARESLNADDASQARFQLSEATRVLDEACKGRQQNGPMQYRAFQGYWQIVHADPEAKTSPAKLKEYEDRMDACLTAALAQTAKMESLKDPLATDVVMAAAEWKAQHGKAGEEEKIIRGYYESHKDQPRARLAMAKLLERKTGDSKAQDEAVAILSQPQAKPASVEGGFAALIARDLQAQLLAELVRVHMAEFGAAQAPPDAAPAEVASAAARRKVAGDKVDQELDQLRHVCPPKSVLLLDLVGRLHLLKGEDVEAVKTLEDAASQMTTATVDYNLLYQLAIAYNRTGQPGMARQRLENIVLQADKWPAPRLLLAQLLLQANDLQGAAVQLKKLQELAPDDPDVKRLADGMALANEASDPSKARLVYDKLPESDRNQRMVKARVAIGLNRMDEAVRLLQDIVKEFPADTEASINLATIEATKLGQLETAKNVLADALKHNPDDPALVQADCRLRDLLPEQTYARVLAAVQKTSDSFVREMQSYELETGPGGHPEKAFGHLTAAAKLKPDDLRVLDLTFAHYLTAGKFDEASAAADKLAAINGDRCGGLMYRYRFDVAKGDLAGAEGYARQLIQHYQEFAASWLVAAQVLQARGKYDESSKDYLEVLKRQPNQVDALRGLIGCYYRLNQIDSAKLALMDACRAYPNDAYFREALLDHQVNYGESAAAIPARERILQSNLQRHIDHAEDYLSLAKACFHAAQDDSVSKPDESASLLNKAFQTLGAGKNKFPQDGRFYSQMAEMYLYNRDLARGEQLLKDFRDLPEFATSPEPALLLSDFYARANKLDLAERYLNEALVKATNKGDGSILELRLRLAALLSQEKKFADAYVALDAVGAASKDDPRVVRQRFEILIAEGKRDEARKAILAALAKSDNPSLRDLLASLMIDDRQLDAARTELDRVLAVNPKDDAALYLQSLAIAKQGDVSRAVTELVGLRERDPRNAQVRLLLAELYSKTGKIDYAMRELIEGLEKIPLNRDMRLALIRLYHSKQPVTNDDLNAVIKLATVAEADPVLHSDPTWAREEALAYVGMTPPNVPLAIEKWHEVMKLSDDVEYRRQFVDLLLQLHDYVAVVNETDKLLKDGHNEWWLHYQRGDALARLNNKADSLSEFDKALAATNATADAGQAEFILRGMGTLDGYDQSLQRVARYLPADPDNRWHLLQAALLRATGDFEHADQIVTALLADPANKSGERRIPLLRAKADIWSSRPVAEKLDPAKTRAAYLKARDAYVEVLKFLPDDIITLNNLAYLLSEQISPPEGGPQKAKEYSSRAYDLIRSNSDPNVMVLDTQGWILTLCGGDDAPEGLRILKSMIVDRQDTKSFVEGRYHLGEAYLKASSPDPAAAQKWLKQAMDLIAQQEKTGQAVDAGLKDKVQTALAKATGPITER